MDPLSVTASAIAILQISGIIINTCYDYRSRVKSSAKDASRIINELNGLRGVIESLFVLLDDEPDNNPSERSNLQKLAEVDGVLETCKVGLEALEKKLEPKEGWRAVRAAIFWPLKETDVTKALLHIDRTKSSLQLALAADQRKTALTIQKGIESLTEQFSASVSNTQREKIFQWLSATNSSSRHNVARSKCQDKTGLWFLEGQAFNLWSRLPMSFLWIYGIPGSGKTILCSTIIDTLRRRYPTSEGNALAYFYFDFNDNKKSKVDFLVRSLIAQLYGQTPHTPVALEKLFIEFQDGSFQPPLSDLAQVLLEIMTACFPNVYIVIDALDECEELDEMLQLLQEMKSWNSNNLHIVVTSRDLVDINASLSQVATAKVCLQASTINQDISIYLAERLKTDTKLAKWPPGIQKTIRNRLNEGANGMFRWVECQLDSLRKCHTIKDLKRDLDTLPKTLEDTYEQILLRINEDHRGSALKILQWLCFAARPVTIQEAAEVLAVDLDGPCYDPELKPLDPRDILFLCSTLVTSATFSAADEPEILPTYDEYDFVYDESQVIRLAHLSVKDYLLSGRIKSTKVSFFAVEPRLTNLLITQSCLVYLLQPSFATDQFHKQHLMDRLNRYPLYHYAAHFWPFHIEASGNNDIDDKTWRLLVQFFDTRNTRNGGNYVAWVLALTPGIKTALAIRTQPLYYAASFGNTSLIRKLLSSDPSLDINATGSRFDSTALQVAVYRNHPAAVKLLLECNADPAKANKLGESCLFWAVLRRHGEVQKILEEQAVKWTEADAYRLEHRYGMKIRSVRK